MSGLPFGMMTISALKRFQATAEESTAWNAPSSSVTLISTVGYPASTPFSSEFLNPFSTAGQNSLGTLPPPL